MDSLRGGARQELPGGDWLMDLPLVKRALSVGPFRSRQALRAGRWRRPGGGLESRLAWRWRRGQRGGRWLALGGSAFRAAGSRAAGRTSGACDPRESRSLLPWTGCMRFLDCFIFLKHQILFNSTETGQLLWAEPKLVVSQTKKLFPVIFV